MRRGAVTYGPATSQYDGTALVQAASGGHTDMVELLLDRGGKLEVKDSVSVAVESCGATGRARRHGWAAGTAMAMTRRGVVLLSRSGV